nr:hypothetical protein [Tanacetum cinerariifolium]
DVCDHRPDDREDHDDRNACRATTHEPGQGFWRNTVRRAAGCAQAQAVDDDAHGQGHDEGGDLEDADPQTVQHPDTRTGRKHG